MTEIPFQKATRLTLEADIKAAYLANDMLLVDEKLKIYPYGKERNEISYEIAHEVARRAIKNARQITTEFEAVA